jgi:hypothetical protein
MLRIINKTHLLQRNALSVAIRPFSLRYSSTTPNNNNVGDHSHKIYALPFKLPEEKVSQIVNIASYVNQHAFLGIFKIIKSVSGNFRNNGQIY